jgi:hypothetical protein
VTYLATGNSPFHALVAAMIRSPSVGLDPNSRGFFPFSSKTASKRFSRIGRLTIDDSVSQYIHGYFSPIFILQFQLRIAEYYLIHFFRAIANGERPDTVTVIFITLISLQAAYPHNGISITPVLPRFDGCQLVIRFFDAASSA